jgi:hypothetical protein
VILALLDQSATFDTVDHAILLDRLEARFGISGSALPWLSSYLNGRRQSVSIGGISSVPTTVIYGVPQGSVLGPILYILYNTPMHDISVASGIMDHYFADDAQGYKSFRQSPSAADQRRLAFATLSSAITEQRNWLSLNRLKLNEDKTDALLVSSKDAVRKKNISSMSLMVGDVPISPSPVVLNLGVRLDSHPTMESQITSSCRKTYFHLRRIARIRRFLSRSALCQLVHALVLSQLDYGNCFASWPTSNKSGQTAPCAELGG